MSARTNRFITLIIVLALATFVAWSIIAEMPLFVPIAGFIIALLLISVCRRFTREIMVDERLQMINQRASAMSYRISTILLAIIGIIFIAIRNVLPSDFEIIGSTLAYSVCIIMLVHLAFYSFYKNRL